MGYRVASLSQSFAKATIATTYAAGQLIANSSLAASVTPLSFPVGANFVLNNVAVASNSTVNAQAKFKVQLYGASPTVANGDGGVWLTTNSNYIDSVAVDCSVNSFSAGTGTANTISGQGAYVNNTLASSIPTYMPSPYTTIFALVTANASWIASSTTSMTVTLNGEVYW